MSSNPNSAGAPNYPLGDAKDEKGKKENAVKNMVSLQLVPVPVLPVFEIYVPISDHDDEP